MSTAPTAGYALHSGRHNAALVSWGGSINRLCIPRFDGPSIFGRLLGDEAGHWSIRAMSIRWLEVGVGVPGFHGSAVGRTLWPNALVDHPAGRSSDSERSHVMLDRYRRLTDLYPRATSGQTEAAS